MPVLPLLPVLTIATFSDLKSRRIPNLLILIAILPGGFFLGQSFLLRLWFICLLCYPLFRLHLVGAGDVKLLAVIAAWSEPDSFVSFLFCSLLLAAIPALFLLLRRRHSGSPMAPCFLLSFNCCQVANIPLTAA
ncbi:MAG: prepilin peptidase [Lachnospiraceae bacterium]